MFVPNATLARILRSVALDPSPRQVAKIRALSSTGLVGTAAYAYFARQTSGTLPRRPLASALAEDTTGALVRLQFGEAEAILRTMIAAAAAEEGPDLRDDERRIVRYLRDAGATPGELAYAEAESRSPGTPDDIAQDIAHQETAIELYAGALLACDGSGVEARNFLGRLAHALDLPYPFLGELHAAWGETAPGSTPAMEPLPVQR